MYVHHLRIIRISDKCSSHNVIITWPLLNYTCITMLFKVTFSALILFGCILDICKSFRAFHSKVNYRRHAIENLASDSVQYLPTTAEDMQRLAFILANISDHIDTKPEVALSIASVEMGWLYSRNVTG